MNITDQEIDTLADDYFGPIDEVEPDDWRGFARALLSKYAAPVMTPELEAEAFIQAAIDNSPEPLRRLGEYLTHVLEEDQWATAERMLLSACAAPVHEQDAKDAQRLNWLEQHNGRFYNKDRISSIVGTGFLVAGDGQGVRYQSIRHAIDAAIAQQGKGE